MVCKCSAYYVDFRHVTHEALNLADPNDILFTAALGLVQHWAVRESNFQKSCYLHDSVQPINCATCGVKQVSIPRARPGSGNEFMALSICYSEKALE